jgi:predicted acylesterase/phospholipase RssA
LPLIFEDFQYLNKFYIDGGVTENFPYNFAKTIGKSIIGIKLHTETKLQPRTKVDLKTYLYELFFLILRKKNDYEDNNPNNKIILIDVSQINTINFNLTTTEKLDIFSSGYKQISSQF